LDVQSLHVDHRIFPDLGIDKAAKGQSEGPVEAPSDEDPF
jgi:hypothetical protein